MVSLDIRTPTVPVQRIVANSFNLINNLAHQEILYQK